MRLLEYIYEGATSGGRGSASGLFRPGELGEYMLNGTMLRACVASLSLLALSGCANLHLDPYDPAQRAIGGALIGAGSGAAIGGAIGGLDGAAIGAAAGGVVGAIAGAATVPPPPTPYYPAAAR